MRRISPEVIMCFRRPHFPLSMWIPTSKMQRSTARNRLQGQLQRWGIPKTFYSHNTIGCACRSCSKAKLNGTPRELSSDLLPFSFSFFFKSNRSLRRGKVWLELQFWGRRSNPFPGWHFPNEKLHPDPAICLIREIGMPQTHYFKCQPIHTIRIWGWRSSFKHLLSIKIINLDLMFCGERNTECIQAIKLPRFEYSKNLPSCG